MTLPLANSIFMHLLFCFICHPSALALQIQCFYVYCISVITISFYQILFSNGFLMIFKKVYKEIRRTNFGILQKALKNIKAK